MRLFKLGNVWFMLLICVFASWSILVAEGSSAPAQATGSVSEPEMISVKGGCFQMGVKNTSTLNPHPDEFPNHEVCVDNFYIGKYEITQREWQSVMGNNPSYDKECGLDCPVETVSWNDVMQYISKRSKQTGKKYRLLTEAEWEYAARSGGKHELVAGTNIRSDMTKYGWIGAPFGRNSKLKLHRVGQKKPNDFGLYDMTGNVSEWVADRYGGNYYTKSPSKNPKGPGSGKLRVTRGGSFMPFRYKVCSFRVTDRCSILPEPGQRFIGFRVALSAED